jgi:hypothetical protein
MDGIVGGFLRLNEVREDDLIGPVERAENA